MWGKVWIVGAVLLSYISLISAQFTPENIPEYNQHNIWTKDAQFVSQMQWTEDSVDKCFIYIAGLPNSDWTILDGQYIPGGNNLTISDIYYRDDCLEECRKIAWCRSADFSEGYDRCHLQTLWGEDKLQAHAEGYVHYIEKPQCYAADVAGPGSADYMRLGFRLIYSGYTTEALTAFDNALKINPFSPVSTIGRALSQLLMGDDAAARTTMQNYQTKYVETGKNYVAMSEQEESLYNITRQNLVIQPSSNAVVRIADSIKNIYVSGPAGFKNRGAGIVAGLLFKQAGELGEFIEMLDALLLENNGDKIALRLKLTYLTDEKPAELRSMVATLVPMVQKLLENNDDPRAWFLATRVMYYIGRNEDAVNYGKTALERIVATATQGYPPNQFLMSELSLWYIIHAGMLNKADLTEASKMIQNVTTQVRSASSSNAASFQTLLNMMRWRQYFAYWFTGDDEASLPSDPNVVADIADSTLPQRIYQLNLQMAVVFNNLQKNGATGSGYQSVLSRLDNVINNNPTDSTGYITAAKINKLLLQAEYAIKSTDNLIDLRTQLLGDDGYLRLAKEMYDSLSYQRKSSVILNPYEVMVDIIQQMSKMIAGPILISGAAQDLRAIRAGLINSTLYTPSINSSLSWVQYALGNNAEARAILIRLKDSLVSETFSWLEESIAVVSKTSLTEADLGVGRRLGRAGDTIRFGNDADKNLYDNLSKGANLRWTADTSLYDECTSDILKWERTETPREWSSINDVSVRSSEMKYYAAASTNICKLRCLYETSFECVAFTYGYGRCLLHNEIRTSENQLSDLRDETYYQKPTCNFGADTSNGYSQMMLGVKALSNGLVELAREAFDEAIEYDPGALMPNILKALTLSADSCTIDEAENTIGGFSNRMTDQENAWHVLVNSIVSGSLNQNALEQLMQDYPEDSLAKSLYNELTPDATITNPENAWDIITFLSRTLVNIRGTKIADINWTDINNRIANLQTISPYSPMPGYLKTWIASKRGLWELSRSEADATITKINQYFDSDIRPVRIENVILQRKHKSYVQQGKYSAAREMYLDVQKNNKELANLLFGHQVFVDRINGVNMKMLVNSELTTTSHSCSSIPNNQVIAQVMNSVQRYVKTSEVPQAKTDVDIFLNGKSNVQMWKLVSDLFYAISTGQAATQSIADFSASNADAPQLAPLAFPARVSRLPLRLGQPDLRMPIVDYTGLRIWYRTALGLIDTVTKRDEAIRDLNDRLASWPNQIVPLWLKFKVYYDWSMKEKSQVSTDLAVAAAEDVLRIWSNPDSGTYQATAMQNFIANPTSTQSTAQVPGTTKPTQTEPTQTADAFPWWVILIIGILVVIIILTIVIVAGCHTKKKAKRDREKQSLYSGSIHSASGHNVRADHGDIQYGGGRNYEGMTETAETHDRDFST